MRKQRVTLRQIAAEAGVSVMTVSYALRNRKDVAAATRERIARIAAEMGYVPDPALSALAAYRHQQEVASLHAVLGAVRVTAKKAPASGPYAVPSYLEPAIRRGRSLGYVVRVFSPRPTADALARAADDMWERGIRGVILSRADGPVDELPFLWSRFAAVRISGNPTLGRLRNITINATQGMTLVVDQLQRRGYRRPGLVYMPHVSERSMHQWPRAWGLARLMMPEAAPTPWPVPPDRSLEEQTDLFRRWVKDQRLDCVLFAEHGWLLSWLTDGGWRVPEDVGFVSLHHQSPYDHCTSLLHNGAAMGEAAVDLLHSLLHANDLGGTDAPYTLMVACQWHEGKTLRPPGP